MGMKISPQRREILRLARVKKEEVIKHREVSEKPEQKFSTEQPQQYCLTAKEQAECTRQNLIVISCCLLIFGVLGYCFRLDIAKLIHEAFDISVWRYGRTTLNLVTAVSVLTGLSSVIAVVTNWKKIQRS